MRKNCERYQVSGLRERFRAPRLPQPIWYALQAEGLTQKPDIIKAIDALLDNNNARALELLEADICRREYTYFEAGLLLHVCSRAENPDDTIRQTVKSQSPDFYERAQTFVKAWRDLIFPHRRDTAGVVPRAKSISPTGRLDGRPYR